MALTDLKCKSAKSKAKTYRITDGGGLYLEVMPNGSKYWRLKYRINGKEKRLALGVYPSTPLTAAREGRDNAKRLLKEGTDPSFAKQETKRQRTLRAEHNFEAIAREWHDNQKARWTPHYAQNLLQRLENDIFPRVGSRPVAEITAPELLETVRRIENRGAHEIARRTLRVCGQVFTYSIATGRAERNPAMGLSGALKPYKKTHFAALDAKELPEFLRVLERNDARLYAQTRHAVKLLMLTFVRTSELINATWEEFDLDKAVWEIPATRMKMRKPHIVPLSQQAIEILQAQKELTGKWQWVFPNSVRPAKSMSNNTILMALKRLGYKDKTTGHGFRALAMSTIKEALGYRHEVVDRQLAHAPRNKIDAAYDRAAFLKERTKMMQEWADFIDAAASEGKIVVRAFQRKKA